MEEMNHTAQDEEEREKHPKTPLVLHRIPSLQLLYLAYYTAAVALFSFDPPKIRARECPQSSFPGPIPYEVTLRALAGDKPRPYVLKTVCS